MAKFKLVALHLPSQENIEYGPWEADEDPIKAVSQVAFAQGFVCGWHSAITHGEGGPEDLALTVVEVPEDKGAQVIGVVTAHASATVTHADGSVD